MYPNDSLDQWHQGQGLWADVPPEDWNSWTWQLRNRITRVEQLEEHLESLRMNVQAAYLPTTSWHWRSRPTFSI